MENQLTQVVTPKPAVKSRTIIFNGLSGVIAPWGAYATGAIPLPVAVAMSVVAAINIGLRFVTDSPITLSLK